MNSNRYRAGVRQVNDATAPAAYLKMTGHFTFGTDNCRLFDTAEAARDAAQREANRLTLALGESFFPGVELEEAAPQVDHYAFYLEPHHTAFRYATLDELNGAVAYAEQHDKAHAAFVIFTDGTRKPVAA